MGLGTPRWRDLKVSFGGPQRSLRGEDVVLGSGDQLQSVLPRFALESGKFALLTTTIKFLGAPIHPDLSLGEESIIETGQIACHGFHGIESSQLGS